VLAADTEYIARIDSDDLVVKGRFEKQINYLNKNKKVAVVGSQIQFIDKKGKVKGYSRYPINTSEVKEEFAHGSQVAHPSVMFRKSCVLAVGNYQDFEIEGGTSIIEDLFLWFRILDKYEIANLPDVLISYRQHAGQSSFKHKLKIEEATLRLLSIKLISQVINKEFKLTYEKYPAYRKSTPLEFYDIINKNKNISIHVWIQKVRIFYFHELIDKVFNFQFLKVFPIMKNLLLFNYFYIHNKYRNSKFKIKP
jgi:hypothetical protein